MDQGSSDQQPSQTFTHQELSQYNGKDKPQVYLGLKGEVFDVSNSDFYKEGGAYHVFAGHDASVALAKMSKEPEFLDPIKYNWKDCLDEKEQGILDDWYNKLKVKYTHVGFLPDN